MSDSLSCYRCGTSLAALSLPLRRLDECPECSAQVHVCRMCVSYDPHVADQCTEDDAPEVRNKEGANFCDYFKPSPRAYRPAEHEATQRAEATLRALFGEAEAPEEQPPSQTDDALRHAESLFKK